MTTTARTITIGNVLRADIRGFVVASRIPEPEVPTFGALIVGGGTAETGVEVTS